MNEPIRKRIRVRFWVYTVFLLIFILLEVLVVIKVGMTFEPSSILPIIILFVMLVSAFVGLVFWTRKDLAFWRDIDAHRLKAVENEYSTVVEHTVGANALHVPVRIVRLGPTKKQWLLFIFGILVAIWVQSFVREWSIPSLRALLISAITFCIILLLVSFIGYGRNMYAREIVLNEEGIEAVYSSRKKLVINWSDVKVFGVYCLSNQSEGVVVYELANEQDVARWNWTGLKEGHVKVEGYQFDRKKQEEREQLVAAVNALIMEKTGLKLYDLYPRTVGKRSAYKEKYPVY